MHRFVMLLAALALLLAACVPGSTVRMHDLYLYGTLNARLSHFYGAAGEFLYQGGTVTLSEPAGDDRRLSDQYAVRGALFVDGRPYLREAVTPLERPAVSVSRIPFTTDLQVTVNLDVEEVVYFDGSDFLRLLEDGDAGTVLRVVPRPLLNRLRGLGELSNAEADMLVAALRSAGEPTVLAVLPQDALPSHAVDGLTEQRRTGLYLQTNIPTDEAAFRPAPTQLTWEVMAQGQQAVGFTGTTFELVTSADQLLSLWNRAYGNQLSVPPVPRVDFQRETVVAIFAGQKSTGGYGVEVERVSEENGELYLDVRFTSPGEGAITTQALTSPWVMVRVLRGGYQVAWLRDPATGNLIGAARGAL